ncbi:HAD-superfamily hydrolase [Halosimplex carlsbadense 2-9-1]|uniref:HAD-superfamily hydrolase n=1 Tax=Halosimplex carlsbadense 2-9-1 TaxID=797114 RepID=M0D3A0_9EURY|nr:HAD family phosphatase [Halosimplex carlsbadense]ELZ29167.1 HAD-superfamily hydrolase [Halosimplex carlsbadense 2-9-1]
MDAVCFDMDGVLVDSEDYWHPYEREELLPLIGLEDLDLDEITGMNYREIYDYLAETYAIGTDREAFLGWYEETATAIYGEEVALLDSAESLLAELRERGVTLALVSSSPHDWIDVVLDRFDLTFDAVVSADAFGGPGKPEPGVYEHAAERIGVDPADVVAVEDSLHGIESAGRAGMHVVGFRHGAADETDRSGADYVADSPTDLREHLLARVED